MFGIWGFMAGVIPATAAVVNVFRLFTADGLVVEGAGQIRGSNFMESIASILLVSIFLVICGYILRKRMFMALAVLNVLFYAPGDMPAFGRHSLFRRRADTDESCIQFRLFHSRYLSGVSGVGRLSAE